MYLIKTPGFIQGMFPNFVWKMPNKQQHIYLTFDDGPVPEATPWVLDCLKEYDAKATFFCVGENVERYPGIYDRIQKEGHTIGNHTFRHINGWFSENNQYIDDVASCASTVKSNLFRPPYGKIKPNQAKLLREDYKIVMWDILSGDFDPAVSKEQCLTNIIDHANTGSIVVLHDSVKTIDKLKYVLPKVLEELSNKGYVFKNLNELNTHLN